jgi:hypothetical protein
MTQYKVIQLPVGWDAEVLSLILEGAVRDGWQYVQVIDSTVLVLGQ